MTIDEGRTGRVPASSRSERLAGVAGVASSFWRSIGWAGVLLFVAYAVATGPAVALQNADSLIPVFVSLESWTLFYWGQNRFGMLIPLLATPVHGSFANLLVQNILSTLFFLVGTAAAFARFRVTRPALWAIALVCLLVTLPGIQITLLLFTTNQSYAPALGCFGLALWLCRAGAIHPGPAALALMLLGAWVNGGVALFATLAALALALVRQTRPLGVPMLVGSLASLGGHQLLQAFASGPFMDTTPIVHPAPGRILGLLATFWTETYEIVGPAFWVVFGLLWMLAIGLALHAGNRRRELATLASFAAAALAYGCVMALFLHGGGRHMMAALPVCLVASLIVLARTSAISDRFLRSPWVAAATLVWLLALTGLHRPSTVRRDLIAHLGQGYATKLYAQQVNVVTGDYWSVWPVVFALNLLHEHQSGRRPVLPVTIRSERLHSRLRSELNRETVVAIIPSGGAGHWHTHGDLPELRILESHDSYDLARIASAPTAVRAGIGARSTRVSGTHGQ